MIRIDRNEIISELNLTPFGARGFFRTRITHVLSAKVKRSGELYLAITTLLLYFTVLNVVKSQVLLNF